jgi:hypothetical protein
MAASPASESYIGLPSGDGSAHPLAREKPAPHLASAMFSGLTRTLLAGAATLAAWALEPAGPAPSAAPMAVLAAGPYRALEHSWWIGPDRLTLRSEPWFAGAVSSLKFRGVEFIDSADHGRLLQGAVSFGGLGECLNPTQAGASKDRRGRTSSQLLWGGAEADRYATATRMAYWKRPGEACRPHEQPARLAANQTDTSDVVYAQQFRFGHGGFANAVEAQITFTTTQDQPSAVVEAITAYTPPSFNRFYVFKDGRLAPDGAVRRHPGEQPAPVVLATADGTSALGFLSLAGDAPPGYGRFTFENTNKINLVYRPKGAYRAGAHGYRMVWVIGTLEEVETTLRGLTAARPRGWTTLFDKQAP